MREYLTRLKKNPKLANDFLIGNYRHFIYLNATPLIREHIREQYEWRLKIMNKECLYNGECVVCGCKTPEVLMCTKGCEHHCYPRMISRKNWKRFINQNKL